MWKGNQSMNKEEKATYKKTRFIGFSAPKCQMQEGWVGQREMSALCFSKSISEDVFFYKFP